MNSLAGRSKRRKPRLRGSFSWRKVLKEKQNGHYGNEGFYDGVFAEGATSDYSSCSSFSDSSRRSGMQRGGSCCDRNWSDVDVDLELDQTSGDEEEEVINTRRTRTLKHKNVTVIIPEQNKSGYIRDDFYLEFIDDPGSLPPTDSRTLHVSKVVSVGPHGARFYNDLPAVIYLPLTEKPRPDDLIVCLCSNTPKEIPPQWEAISSRHYTYKNGHVIIKANHFSLFTVVLERPFPESRRLMPRDGGTLRIPEVPGVEVNFPSGAIACEMVSFVRVLYDREPGVRTNIWDDVESNALASPIIMVGPHGYTFVPGSDCVTVRLPIPHYTQIRNRFGKSCRLTVWYSSTTEDEPLVWERLETPFTLKRDVAGIYTVVFPVGHFSFFKVLWDVISSSLYEAKLGVAFFYPYVSFSMMCQAWMEENKDTQRFGLEVICYRSDKKLLETTNYKYKVGSSLKPKLVRPGCIIVRLKSELFEADIDAGEDLALVKIEPDFRGREFEKQFACRFKQNKPVITRGAFGKVVVERKGATENMNEPLFEFNLHKTGIESEPVPPDTTDRWSIVAVKELAATLHILEDGNWKKLATHIGFTKKEINSKLMYSADPFLAMMNLYQSRGGTPEEFLQSLNEVSRQINLQGGGTSPTGSCNSNSPTGSTNRGSNGGRRWRSLWNMSPTKWRNNADSDSESNSAATEASTSSRKRTTPSDGSGSSAKRKRRNFSDASETMSSSEESSNPGDSSSYGRKLSDTDMWTISQFIDTMNWHVLGRSVGLEESLISNIEHKFKSKGFRECAYQMLLEWKCRKPQKCTLDNLHRALIKERMNSVSKQLSAIKLGEEQET